MTRPYVRIRALSGSRAPDARLYDQKQAIPFTKACE